MIYINSEIFYYKVTKGQKLVRTDEAADVIGQDYAEPNKDDDYAYMSTKECVPLLFHPLVVGC